LCFLEPATVSYFCTLTRRNYEQTGQLAGLAI
jgi:hypothetical protein